MTGELTLELDQTVIERAEQYAERRGVSLAKLVESFFAGITREGSTPPAAPGVVAELAGLVGGAEVADPRDDRYTDSEIEELMRVEPLAGAEIVEAGLTGGWADQGITDTDAWIEQTRRNRRARQAW